MKIHSTLFFSAVLGALGCTTPKESQHKTASEVAFTHDYLPFYFADSPRVERMKNVFPVINKIYTDYAEKNHFPGMAFGLVADGKLIYSNAIGFANIASKIPATIQTDFRIASMTKSFTAMSILRLRDEGKLRLQDPVSNYIPEVAKIRYLTKDSAPITIENLLTMSAGFPEDNPWGDRQLENTDESLLAFVRDGISFSNVPGLNYEYSNLGFALLGRIVTIVSGKSYQRYISENILGPLQMNDTHWEFTQIEKEKLALGYAWKDNQWMEEPLLHDGAFGAMGGLICSVKDFSKYLAFHLSAWPPRNEGESSVLKRSSLREMQQLQRLGIFTPDNHNRSGMPCPVITGYGYGLGWRKDCSGIVCVRHGGGLPGFGSEWRFYPEYGIGVVALSNLTYGGLGLANAKVLDTLILLARLKPRNLPLSSILAQRQKEIVEVLPSWTPEKLGIFAKNFFLDKSLESRKQSTLKLLLEVGKIIKVKPIVPDNQLRGTFILEGEKMNVSVFFTLTPENNPLIQQLDLSVIPRSN